MARLIQLVYASVATGDFSPEKVHELLNIARRRNARRDVTGMLLYAKGSFFQVLEGKPEAVERVMDIIQRDTRHNNITVITREPIAERCFGDWTMGHADLSENEIKEIVGASDFFNRDESSLTFGEERVKKLLKAFRSGSWRTKIKGNTPTTIGFCTYRNNDFFEKAIADKSVTIPDFSYAFQPIVSINDQSIYSYEALLRTTENGIAHEVLDRLLPSQLQSFYEQSHLFAMYLAASNGLCCHLNINIMPTVFSSSPEAIEKILHYAQELNINPRQIILEILESELIESLDTFSGILREYRSSGLRFAIDDFGSGYAGMNLLAEFQPELLKLDLQLIRDVDKKGPRQAIIRGIIRTCADLGIDIIAEGVETEAEYRWLRDEGIELFQGYLFARPSFEKLENAFTAPV
ncbi:MAG: EAL domain-containing protein [Fibrobacteria bacterium]|nr:EAL domain-containing protein [Fibrobacteria bacterium]